MLCGFGIAFYCCRITLCGFVIELRSVILELHNVQTLKLGYVIQYQRSLTTYLRNRPENLDHLLLRKGAVDHAIIRSVEPINEICYSLEKL